MKTKNNFLMGALITAASLGVVGSITGTYAWFSYNTKTPISFSGITTGDSENLQVRFLSVPDKWEDDEWKQTLSADDFSSYSKKMGYAEDELQPVTFATSQVETSQYGLKPFYGMPSFCEAGYSTVGLKAGTGDDEHYVYSQVKLQFRCINPADTTEFFEQNIYISDITVKAHDDDYDVSDAIRVHISSGDYNYLIAPGATPAQAGDTTVVTDLWGPLDLNGDGYDDEGIVTRDDDTDEITNIRAAYDWESDDVETIEYGVENATETAYTKEGAEATFVNGKYSEGGIIIGTTTENELTPLDVVITIYLQGWAKSCKNDNLDAGFDLGITFQCDLL